MLNILTGLPKNKNDDNTICNKFANSIGNKIILGSSTMKMYCRELDIVPEIKMLSNDTTAPKYFIDGITIAAEGVITLNECYKLLSNQTSNNKDAVEIVKLINQENEINFIIGTTY